MPVSTWRRTTSATPSRIVRAAAVASATVPCSRANSTSVTACERGRLPTCVVRIRSTLECTGRVLAERVIRGMVSREPALEFRMRLAALRRIDLLDVGVVERELDDHPVRIRRVNRAAVAVLEHERLRFLEPGLLQPPLDAVLRLPVDMQRDVVEGRERHLRAEL